MKKLLSIVPVVLLLSACILVQTDEPAPTPTPEIVSPVTVSINEAKFQLTLPAGWQAKHSAALWADAKEKFYYEDTQGNYFQVNIDPDGSDFAADAVWRYEKRSEKTIAIAEESPLCKPDDGFCAAGDNQLTIYMLSESVGEVKLGGHDYYFLLWNTQKETGVNLQTFRDIVSSFTVK